MEQTDNLVGRSIPWDRHPICEGFNTDTYRKMCRYPVKAPQWVVARVLASPEITPAWMLDILRAWLYTDSVGAIFSHDTTQLHHATVTGGGTIDAFKPQRPKSPPDLGLANLQLAMNINQFAAKCSFNRGRTGTGSLPIVDSQGKNYLNVYWIRFAYHGKKTSLAWPVYKGRTGVGIHHWDYCPDQCNALATDFYTTTSPVPKAPEKPGILPKNLQVFDPTKSWAPWLLIGGGVVIAGAIFGSTLASKVSGE